MPDRLADAGNTMIPAFLALEAKGYRVWWQRDQVSPKDETWFADGPLGRFSGDGPVSLLGLVALREIRGANWQPTDQQIEQFLAMYSA